METIKSAWARHVPNWHSTPAFSTRPFFQIGNEKEYFSPVPPPAAHDDAPKPPDSASKHAPINAPASLTDAFNASWLEKARISINTPAASEQARNCPASSFWGEKASKYAEATKTRVSEKAASRLKRNASCFPILQDTVFIQCTPPSSPSCPRAHRALPCSKHFRPPHPQRRMKSPLPRLPCASWHIVFLCLQEQPANQHLLLVPSSQVHRMKSARKEERPMFHPRPSKPTCLRHREWMRAWQTWQPRAQAQMPR